jgi:hypothetical protein
MSSSSSSIEETFQKIKQNRPIQECLNTIPGNSDEITASLWFIYYMFFAIHNPKMEDYIQKKLAPPASTTGRHPSFIQAYRDIMKNMINRRNYTSSIVYQLYTYAYTNQGNPTHIYPNYKNDISKQLIKSFHSNHLKTTAVLLRRLDSTPRPISIPAPELITFIEYIITTSSFVTNTASLTSAETILKKINNQISYKYKNIIILAMICYMKIDEADINKKNMFIAATEEDVATTTTTTAANEPELLPSLFTPVSTYDEKYKYLYT